MVKKKRVVMDPVVKGKIDPAVIKKAVRKIVLDKKQNAAAKRKADRELFISQLAGELIRDEMKRAKSSLKFIASTREAIIKMAKDAHISRQSTADICVLAIAAYYDTVFKEAVRPPKKVSKK